jgi:hypothetical protein
MLRAASVAIVIASAIITVGASGSSWRMPGGHVFAILAPSVVLEPTDRLKLDAGEVVTKVLTPEGHDLAFFAAVRVEASADQLAAWTRRISEIQPGRYVQAAGKFSELPRLDDVAGLPIDDGDLEDIRRCRPGDCGVKLSAREIDELQARIGNQSERAWKSDVATGLRRVIVERARGYVAGGDQWLPPYEDEPSPVSAGAAFMSLVHRIGFLTLHVPQLVEYLQRYPYLQHPDVVESFLYWSVDSVGVKPITTISHVSLMRGDAPGLPEVISVSKQVFATHYRNAAISVTVIIGSPETGRYLVYLHRSDVDVLAGTLGGLVRRVIERRIRDEAPQVLQAFRRKLETGLPE